MRIACDLRCGRASKKDCETSRMLALKESKIKDKDLRSRDIDPKTCFWSKILNLWLSQGEKTTYLSPRPQHRLTSWCHKVSGRSAEQVPLTKNRRFRRGNSPCALNFWCCHLQDYTGVWSEESESSASSQSPRDYMPDWIVRKGYFVNVHGRYVQFQRSLVLLLHIYSQVRSWKTRSFVHIGSPSQKWEWLGKRLR